MHRIWNKLHPRFLKRIDRWLLTHNPTIWRTQVHFVLFYAWITALLLFTVGFLYQALSGDLPNIDPVAPIMIHEHETWYFLVIISFFLFGWTYNQYLKGLPKMTWKATLLTLLCYLIGIWTLLGITAPAYRFGTIVHTAKMVMSEEDIREIQDSSYFAYGMMFLAGDTLPVCDVPSDSFLREREALFRKLIHLEDSLLEWRYDFDRFHYQFLPHADPGEFISKRYYLNKNIYGDEFLYMGSKKTFIF